MLTPLDIHNREFHRAVRGYRENEVDEFLDEVVRDFESLLKENNSLKERINEYEEKLRQYKQIEETLQHTLVVAQETAEEVKRNARKEADLIVREAEERAGRLMAEGQEKRRDTEQTIVALQREAEAFRSKVRSLLESQIALLDRAWDLATESASAREEANPGIAGDNLIDSPTVRIDKES